MSLPVILFRASLAEEDELEAAKKYFPVITSRADVLDMEGVARKLVIPRYSALPYFGELVKDLKRMGAEPINSLREHEYVADIRNWYPDFEDVTPKTWMRAEDVPQDVGGPFVLKGMTNSRKNKWRTHMFAPTRVDITRVLLNLYDDPLISEQGVCVRQYEEFEKFGGIEGLAGIPVTNEWRYFILDGEILYGAYYWSQHVEEVADRAVEDPLLGWEIEISRVDSYYFAKDIAKRLDGKIRFAVADVVRREDGIWRLVELNDGQMSGLSAIPAGDLYAALAKRFTSEEAGAQEKGS